MTMFCKTKMLSYGFASALAGVFFVAPFVVAPAQADQTITCESRHGKNEYCAVDVGDGRVELHKKLSDSSCHEGKDWGWDSSGIWVANGCRAKFEVKNGGGGRSRAGTTQTKLPLMNATCPGEISVHYDGEGRAYINGNDASFTKTGDDIWDIKHHGTTVTVLKNPDDSLTVTYTGPHRANGVCRVENTGMSSSEAIQSQRASASERAGQGQFDATGNIPCAQHKGQPMGQCRFGVARDGGGSATVVVTRPDGRTRAIFFEKGKAVSADLSQADGNMDFRATKEADLYTIHAGDERYEIPEAVIFGG